MTDILVKNPTIRRIYTIASVLILLLIVVGPAPAGAAPIPDTKIMTPDQVEEGMTGHGRTVFYGQSIDTFGVEVVGVLENVMPDQDLILVEANHPLLKKTKIMSGMSGSPVYVEGKLIGALAYSWPFAKESLAGVTPIKNMLGYDQRTDSLSGGQGSVERITTPLVTSGFNSRMQSTLKSKLREKGFRGRMIAGGGSGDETQRSTSSVEELTGGSALGIQLMRGDLSMTAIGTVTYRDENKIYGFGHPFLNAGKTTFPMTTAEVVSPMPSLQNSFKLATAKEPAGSITQDRQAAVVGQTGDAPSMVPVEIELSTANGSFADTYSVEVVRNKYLSPGLVNMAAANFASSKMSQLGLNRVESRVVLKLENSQDLELGTTSIVSGSFDPWAFLPISGVWDNRFQKLNVEGLRIEMSMKPEQEWASIKDVWLNSNALVPGESATVSVRLQPYRDQSTVRSITLDVPESVQGQKAQLTVVPGSKLISLQARPESSEQLIDYLNNYRKDSQLAVVLQVPRYQLDAAGHSLPNLPYSIGGAYQRAHNSTASFQPDTVKKVTSTPWVLQGQQSLTLPVKP